MVPHRLDRWPPASVVGDREQAPSVDAAAVELWYCNIGTVSSLFPERKEKNKIKVLSAATREILRLAGYADRCTNGDHVVRYRLLTS
jgi:hypothetical protein